MTTIARLRPPCAPTIGGDPNGSRRWGPPRTRITASETPPTVPARNIHLVGVRRARNRHRAAATACGSSQPVHHHPTCCSHSGVAGAGRDLSRRRARDEGNIRLASTTPPMPPRVYASMYAATSAIRRWLPMRRCSHRSARVRTPPCRAHQSYLTRQPQVVRQQTGRHPATGCNWHTQWVSPSTCSPEASPHLGQRTGHIRQDGARTSSRRSR